MEISTTANAWVSEKGGTGNGHWKMDQMPVIVKGKGKGPLRYIDTNVCGITKIFTIDSYAPDHACCILDLNQMSIPFVEFRIVVRSGVLVLHRLACSGELGPSGSQLALDFFISSRSMGIL